MDIKNQPKTANNFECIYCHYKCSKVSNWNDHLSTRKHNFLSKGYIKDKKGYINPAGENENSTQHVCDCGKNYTHYSGLWRHKKVCKVDNGIVNVNANVNVNTNKEENLIVAPHPPTDIEMLTTMFIESIKQNQEFQKQMFELMKDTMVTNTTNCNNNNMVNSNNNFNLNLFLNETCKDAMNIKDFIDSLQVQFKDLEYNGENGYAAGISNIFLRELNKLDVCKRPIHCSDAKREVFHIKNEDGWEKERELLIKCIKQITRKNIVLLADWRNAHPGCMDLHNKINNKYNKINCETLGPYLDDEELKCFNRIIANVAKATVIDKKCVGSAP
jgi:hypothetical protein